MQTVYFPDCGSAPTHLRFTALSLPMEDLCSSGFIVLDVYVKTRTHRHTQIKLPPIYMFHYKCQCGGNPGVSPLGCTKCEAAIDCGDLKCKSKQFLRRLFSSISIYSHTWETLLCYSRCLALFLFIWAVALWK